MFKHPVLYFLPLVLFGGAALLFGIAVRDQALTSMTQYPVELTWTQFSNWLYWIAGVSVLVLLLMWGAYASGKRRPSPSAVR